MLGRHGGHLRCEAVCDRHHGASERYRLANATVESHALQDKPLAVIGPTDDGYSGAWARHHTEESGRFTETLVIEPITVTTLCEAVTWLAEQVNITRATRAGQRYDPGLMTTLTPDMKLRSDFGADRAAEFDVGRLHRQLAKPEARLKEFERGAEIG
jgi:hypothetical protein